MELIKQVVRLGNSAGVVLPREWYGGEARVELVRKPLSIKEDILKILDNYLEDVLGIYLVGSYAREEWTSKSDVDVLVVTSNTNKRIKKGKYDVLMISSDEIKSAMKIVIPIVPMMLEAVVILNKQLLESLKVKKISQRDLKWHRETTWSALEYIKQALELDKEMGVGKISGNLIYPLMLRLRQVYIVDCLLKGRKYRKKDFVELLKNEEIYELYEGYELEKRDKKAKAVDRDMAERTYRLIEKYFRS